MILVLQIAAGIVLAYLVIRFRHTAWALAVGLLTIAAIVAVVIGVSAGASYVADTIPIDWEKIVTLAAVIPLFGLAGIGAYGLLTLFRITFGTERPSAEGDGCYPVLLLFGFLNMLILAAVSAAVDAAFPNNPIGRLSRAIDEWSRAAGQKDLGSSIFGAALMAMWPWLIIFSLAALSRFRKRPKADNPEGDKAEGPPLA
ncbi:hypothetical protein [Sphingopyxis sp.]|uniref:hypothetical protein n=1 Tax=Sphingopyxis sp. TaxID=1908224 RepID=UPI0035AEAE03